MTPADRRALAAALRHGRTRYAFRTIGRVYCWYPKPFTGHEGPALQVADLGGGQWLLEFGMDRIAVDSVGFALAALEFFGVYQPAMAEVAG